MNEENIKKLNIDRFPGSLEAVTFRKGTQDYGVIFAVPPEMREFVKPLMDKINHYFVSYCFGVRDAQQAESLLQAKENSGNVLPDFSGEAGTDRFCSLDDIASMLSMSSRNALLYAQKGVLIKVSRGRYDLTRSIQNYIKEIRTEQRSGGRRNEVLTEKEEIQKERLLVKLLLEKKKLVNAEECVREVEKHNFNVRNKLLYLPTKLAPLITGKMKTSEIKEILEDHVRECLTELAGLDPSRMGSDESKQDFCPTAKIKRKRVGGRKKGSKRI